MLTAQPARSEDLGKVVTVDLDRVPAKCLPAGRNLRTAFPWGLSLRDGLSRPAVLLEGIHIEQYGQVVQSVTGCDECRFPDLSFLAFAVAHHHPGVPALSQATGAKRPADA